MDRELFLALLTTKISRELSDEEASRLAAALTENPEFAAITEAIMAHKTLQEDQPDQYVQDRLDALWDQLRQPAEDIPVRRNTAYRRWLKIAAVLMLLSGLGFWMFHRTGDPIAIPVAGMDTLRSGEQDVYTVLNDGTQITLGKHSSIFYNTAFGKNRRQIILEGAAFFDVAKNPKVPLVVQAGTVDIEVKGTAFDVNAYQNRKNVEVVLVRGLVQVTNKYNKKNRVLLSPNQKLLTSSEKQANLLFTVTNFSQDTILPVQNVADTVVFKRQKLENLVRLLERKYEVTIIIQNQSLKEKRFSGLFARETLEEALEALKLSYPFNYKIQEKHVIID